MRAESCLIVKSTQNRLQPVSQSDNDEPPFTITEAPYSGSPDIHNGQSNSHQTTRSLVRKDQCKFVLINRSF